MCFSESQRCRVAILPVCSFHRLASPAAGGASALRPAGAGVLIFIKSKTDTQRCLFAFGGEGETRTPAPVTRPTPLAGAPRHQLEYFSMAALLRVFGCIYSKRSALNQSGGESGIRTHGTRGVRRFSRPFRYDRFGISPFVLK